jgi:hypothetical protein
VQAHLLRFFYAYRYGGCKKGCFGTPLPVERSSNPFCIHRPMFRSVAGGMIKFQLETIMSNQTLAISGIILAISGIIINQDLEGRFCLNDLHKAAGGEEKHKPANWFRNQQTIDCSNLSNQ